MLTNTEVFLGYFTEEKAEKIRAAVHGQSFYSFRVACSTTPGGRLVTVYTDYEFAPEENGEMEALRMIAALLAEA